MTTDIEPVGGGGGVQRSQAGSSLADVVDTILDKGLVIDAYVSASLVGIELLTVNARIVVASVDTYLDFAEAANRLDLSSSQGKGLPEIVENVQEDGSQKKLKGATKGALEAAGEKIRNVAGLDEEKEREPSRSKD
ncbi:gas vesicle protein [Glycomyces luteolus]|uniref:Gas vesicle protein A n=1 Tax=Glycomyces luteolus TaxID=2670330 RepID=A0A9X3PLB6_9ACTN|nr:gas vesicle protein GvpJ [Glycomyces luteolus]MDA1360710.1 gas vesicle protein [Glycomyces luteolus]